MGTRQYSSFQIAQMLQVSRQAVNQWIDKGYMLSYRTPGGHRRVRDGDLIHFLNARQIPVPASLEESASRGEPFSPIIMLVDDEEDYLLILTQAIQQTLPAARVRTFRNGLDALVALGAELPDLLILDLRMPKIDGLEVCRRLKLNPLTALLPIMIVTADEGEDLLARIEAIGVGIDVVCDKNQPLSEITQAMMDFFPEAVSQETASL